MTVFFQSDYIIFLPPGTLAQNSNGDARLVGGRSQYEGQVEVYYNGQWQTVCYGYRTFQDVGDVVCGQLGYGLVSRMRADYRTTSSNTVSVSCSGGQSSLRECSFTEGGSCNYPVTVFCSNSSECNLYGTVLLESAWVLVSTRTSASCMYVCTCMSNMFLVCLHSVASIFDGISCKYNDIVDTCVYT